MYVHIKAVTYITINQINQMYYQSWSGRSTPWMVQHVYSIDVCRYNVCEVLPCRLNMALYHACWKMQKEASVTMWKEKYQNTRIVNEQMLS